MTDVKLVISSICKVLKVVTNVDVQPQHFKTAKFNKLDGNSAIIVSCKDTRYLLEILIVVSSASYTTWSYMMGKAVFWHVLHSLCCTSGLQEGFTPDSKEICKDVVLCVKMCFASCHYDDFTFYCLPHDMNSGNREVLLAFGWLLADTNALETKLLEYAETKLFKDLRVTSAENDRTNEDDSLPKNLTDDDLCNHVIWLAGMIKQNLKAIYSMASEKIHLTSKVQAATKGYYTLPFLSVEQIMFLKSHDKQPDKKQELLNVKSVLEDYFHFIEEEKIFWNWMESVLTEDINNRNIFLGNLSDFEKFLDTLKTDVRKEILKEPADDYIVLFDHLKSKFMNCAYSDQSAMSESLKEIKTDIQQLNSMYKDNVNDITECLEKLKINCQR